MGKINLSKLLKPVKKNKSYYKKKYKNVLERLQEYRELGTPLNLQRAMAEAELSRKILTKKQCEKVRKLVDKRMKELQEESEVNELLLKIKKNPKLLTNNLVVED